MFTGIIQCLGTIREIRTSGQGAAFTVETDSSLEEPREGESIAVNGACLTACTISEKKFTVDVSPETLSRTTLKDLARGARTNLERALRLSDRLGGHMVSGHVDCVGEILDIRPMGQFTVFSVTIPRRLERYLIEKGSVAVDGVSLTVNTCGEGRFSVSVIPHTAKMTTLSLKKTGEKVNIELDLIAKYIEKLLPTGREAESKVDRDLLARHGFF